MKINFKTDINYNLFKIIIIQSTNMDIPEIELVLSRNMARIRRILFRNYKTIYKEN